MKQADRTIVFLAHSLERARVEVETLRNELIEAMKQNQELTVQAEVYEGECTFNKMMLEVIRKTLSLLDLNDPARVFIEGQLGSEMLAWLKRANEIK